MFLLGRNIPIKKKMRLQSGSNILASIEIFSQVPGDFFVADSKDLVPLSFLELSADFNHRGPRLLLLRLASPLLYSPCGPSIWLPQLCLHQLLFLPWVFTACEPGFSVDHTFSRMLWRPSVLALMTTKSVLVPSLSPRLHVQGSTWLLGPPQPPKTLATMCPTSLPRSQLPLTQHQGVLWIPPAPFPPLQPLNLWSPILFASQSPTLPLSLASEAPGPPPSLLFTVTAWLRPPSP